MFNRSEAWWMVALGTSLTLAYPAAIAGPPAKPGPNAKLFGQTRAGVADQMKDPLSTRFRGLYPFTDGDGRKKVCGEVLSKNAYGAYTGWKHFAYFVEAGETVLAPDDDDDEDSKNRVNRLGSGCGFGTWHQ